VECRQFPVIRVLPQQQQIFRSLEFDLTIPGRALQDAVIRDRSLHWLFVIGEPCQAGVSGILPDAAIRPHRGEPQMAKGVRDDFRQFLCRVRQSRSGACRTLMWRKSQFITGIEGFGRVAHDVLSFCITVVRFVDCR
jgi:hypothetical protein